MADKKIPASRRRCANCGAPIDIAHGRIYCAECAKKRRRRKTTLGPEKPEPERVFSRPRRTGKSFDLAGKDIEEVALEAKAVGMSYGEYSNACAFGTIEQKLKMQGMSREEAVNLIKNAKRRRTVAKKIKSHAAP